MKQVFPKEIIESTVQTHIFRHSTKSKVIYLITLLAVLTALALLPFTNVDIYSTSRGIIRLIVVTFSIFPIAIILGLVRYKYGLKYSILLHILNNGLILLLNSVIYS